MVDIEYANAYSEVLGILKCVSKSDFEKVPKDMIELFNNHHNKEYIFEYDFKQTLEEQGVSELAMTIVAILFRDYWATDSQKEKIIKFQNQQRLQEEELRKQKYKCEELFKPDENQDTNNQENESNIIVYKENVFKRIINKIKVFLKNIKFKRKE